MEGLSLSNGTTGSTATLGYWGLQQVISTDQKIKLMEIAKELSKEKDKCFFKVYKKLLKTI